jgi:sortase A
LPSKDSRLPRLQGEGPGGAEHSAPRKKLSVALRLLERGLFGVALLAFGYLGYVALDRGAYEAQQKRRLGELLLAAPAGAFDSHATATAAAPVVAARWEQRRTEPIGRLEIPSVGISTIVAWGTDAATLRRAVGHIDGTALPGEPGNVGLAGHRDTVFRGLRELRPADRIRLVTADGSFEYAVESLRTVEPDRSDVLDPSPHPTLTLVTCYPFNFIGPAPLRFIVRARRVGRT